MAATLLLWLDYVLFVAFILASLSIGVYHSLTGGRQKTIQEFIMADRKLSILPTMLSLTASYQSAIMILGTTAEIYSWGIQAWVIVTFGHTLSLVIVERIIVPWLYPLSLVSVYQYLDMRFHSNIVTILGSAIGVVKAMFYMGIAIYAPSIALEAACGLSANISIPVMAALCTIYTTLGGMRAVIWTDVMQILIMAAGMLAVLIKASIDVGGMEAAFNYLREEDRIYPLVLDPDPTVRHTVWNLLFGTITTWTLIYGMHQASVQRYSALKSLQSARKMILLKIPFSVCMGTIANLIGVAVFGYFAKTKCDPLENGDISSGNQILTYFVGIAFKNVMGFSGLFLATLYSGALSSVSSALSGSAANAWKGILQPLLPEVSEGTATNINKVLVVIFGILATGIAFLAATMPGPVTQISVTFSGAIGGPLLGLFLMGGVLPFVEWRGALAGTVAGLGVNLLVGVGSRSVPPVNFPLHPVSVDGCLNTSTLSEVYFNTTDVYFNTTDVYNQPLNYSSSLETVRLSPIQSLFSLSYQWYTPLGCLVSLAVGCSISLVSRALFGKQTKPVPKKLLMNWRTAFIWKEKKEDNLMISNKKIKFNQPGKETGIPEEQRLFSDLDHQKNSHH